MTQFFLSSNGSLAYVGDLGASNHIVDGTLFIVLLCPIFLLRISIFDVLPTGACEGTGIVAPCDVRSTGGLRGVMLGTTGSGAVGARN